MKVIDLLNKIANGEEVPERIQVYSDIFVFDYSNNIYEHEETRTNLLSIYNGNILNYEVRIKKNKKIPEKIDQNDREWHYLHNTKKTTEEVADNLEHLRQKVNKIIDYLEDNK